MRHASNKQANIARITKRFWIIWAICVTFQSTIIVSDLMHDRLWGTLFGALISTALGMIVIMAWLGYREAYSKAHDRDTPK